ncbi:MAG: alpha/beta fold hydrolase [Solirubrobacteraceae bacterium]
MRPLRLVLAAAALLAAAAPTATAASRTCPGQQDFRCATLSAPLDRNGAAPGTIGLRYAVERKGPKPVLIALSGGPGQSAVSSASSFAVSLQPILRRFRLAVLDQRGTGGSGALVCPSVQKLLSLDAFMPAALESCANRVGARRAFYSTTDTVLDIEALRKRLGVGRIALMGISYGTHVALQYARAYPDRVSKLVLDSIVGPDQPDGFLLDTYRNLPRVLREQCAHNACRGITNDPVADVGAVVNAINTKGPLRGTYYDPRGTRRTTRYATPDELNFLLLSGDLNPFLQAALPGAFSAAARGYPQQLLRLRRIAQGPSTKVKDLSFGLNVITGCEDAALPYSTTTPFEQRPGLAQAALAAVPPDQYAPFDGQTVLRTSYVDDCLRFAADPVKPAFTGPLPDVPAILLGGREDLRTPYENAEATAKELPKASLVALKGSGHDVLDSDITGCSARALARFAVGRTVGTPCAAKDNGVSPLPIPPRTLSDFRSAPGVGGTRGRVLFAALDTASDARASALETLFSGLSVRGGGLYGGRFTGEAALDGAIALRGYAYVPGVRLTGSLKASSAGQLRGTVSVTGTQAGRLTLDGRGGARGRLGGRAVRYGQAGASAATSATRVGGTRMPLWRVSPDRLERHHRQQRLRG